MTEPVFCLSRTAKDSRIVWRWAGGIEERGSDELLCCVLVGGVKAGDGRGEAAFTVDAVVLRVKEERGAVDSLSCVRIVDNPDEGGKGDLVGLPGVFRLVLVPRVVSHERSSPVVGGGLNGSDEVDELNFVGECEGEWFDCFNGEPPGVPARIVDGERPNGDSGRRKGEARPLELNKGAGLRGDGGFDLTC